MFTSTYLSGRARPWTLAVVLWAFGLATTTLLVGLWGRSITTDRTTITASAQAVLSSEAVTDRIHDWLSDGLAAAAAAAGPDVDAALLEVAQSPAADEAIDDIVGSFVDAALAEPGTDTEIDIAEALEPLVPPVVDELGAVGIDVAEEEVIDAMDHAATLVLSTEETPAFAGVATTARSVLTTVLVVGLAAMVLFGSLAVALAEDRVAMIRSLAIRLAVSGGTFVLFLRLGAWATDPARGRSPLVAGGSVVLGSNHLVLLVVTAAALAVAGVAGISIRQRRRKTSDAATDDDDSTSERVLVGVS